MCFSCFSSPRSPVPKPPYLGQPAATKARDISTCSDRVFRRDPCPRYRSEKWFSVACFLHFSLEPHMECNFLHHPCSPRAFKGQSHYARSNCSSDQAIIPTNKTSRSSCRKASASIHIEADSFCLSPLVTLLPRPWSSIARYRPLSRASGDTAPLGYFGVAVQDSNLQPYPLMK
jgi:hypothetical protein